MSGAGDFSGKYVYLKDGVFVEAPFGKEWACILRLLDMDADAVSSSSLKTI